MKSRLFWLKTAAAAASICGALCNFLRIYLCFDDDKMLISRNTESITLLILTFVFTAAALLSAFSALRRETNERLFESKYTPITLTAALFMLLQAVQSALASPLEFQDNVYGALASLFAFLSAVSLTLEAFSPNKRGIKSFVMWLAPLIWSALSLFNIVMLIPNVHSMQGNAEKGIASVLTLLFVYYCAAVNGGYIDIKKSRSAKPLLVLYGVLILPFSLPYIAAAVCGISDLFVNLPHIAMLGFSIYSISLLFKNRE